MLSTLAFILIIVLVIVPQLSTYMNSRRKVADLTAEVNKLESKAAELEKIDIQAVKRDLEVAMIILPADQQVPEALMTLSDLVNKSGLVIKSTSYAAGQKSKAKNGFRLNVTLLGPLDSVRNFLIGLDDSPRLFQIESLVVAFTATPPIVEANLPVSVFYEPPAKGGIPVEKPLPKLSDNNQKLLAKLYRIAPKAIPEIDISTVPVGKANPFE